MANNWKAHKVYLFEIRSIIVKKVKNFIAKIKSNGIGIVCAEKGKYQLKIKKFQNLKMNMWKVSLLNWK